MKSDNLLETIGDIDDEFITEAKEERHAAVKPWVKWSAAAFCLIICTACFFVFKNYDSAKERHVMYSTPDPITGEIHEITDDQDLPLSTFDIFMNNQKQLLDESSDDILILFKAYPRDVAISHAVDYIYVITRSSLKAVPVFEGDYWKEFETNKGAEYSAVMHGAGGIDEIPGDTTISFTKKGKKAGSVVLTFKNETMEVITESSTFSVERLVLDSVSSDKYKVRVIDMNRVDFS